MNIEKDLRYVENLIKIGGPIGKELAKFNAWVKATATKIQEKKYSTEEVVQLKQAFSPLYTKETLLGIAHLKPYGYAGDFEVIDRVYKEYIHPDPFYSNWDKLLQESNGLKAVRNRKEFFKKIVKKYYAGQDFKVLNVASGPCRDVAEYLANYPNQGIQIDCLDHDKNAISYAKGLLKHINTEQYHFIHANIFKFQTTKTYDLIWSAGLFDYFDDTTFVTILKKLLSFLNPNGRLTVGNFSWKSETRYLKEFVDWHLHYRDKEALLALGQEACEGLTAELQVLEEQEGVNLFLEVKVIS